MTNEKAIMCLEDMKIKVPIPKAAKQARENNEALDVAIKALRNEPHWIPSAQPEIIRCKDCIMHGLCRFEQGLGLDGYCSQAERSTDG